MKKIYFKVTQLPAGGSSIKDSFKHYLNRNNSQHSKASLQTVVTKVNKGGVRFSCFMAILNCFIIK